MSLFSFGRIVLLLLILSCPLGAHADMYSPIGGGDSITNYFDLSGCTADNYVFTWGATSSKGRCSSSVPSNFGLSSGYWFVGDDNSTAVAIDPEVVAVTDAMTLSTNQVRGNVICNYGQAAANITVNLPTAAQGMGFIATVSTAQAANYWRFRAGTNDKIYLNGVAGADNGYVSNAAPAIGESMTCWTIQTGASAWDWVCKTTDDWVVP